MSIQIINPITYPGWDDLVLSTPGHSFFHSSAWARVLSESYHYTPKYFSIVDDGKLSASIPVMEVSSFLTGRRGVSLPFTDYCDSINLNGVPFSELLNCIIEYGQHRGWRYLELRGGKEYLASSESGIKLEDSAMNPSGCRPTPNTQYLTASPSYTYLGHVLDLSKNEEQIFPDFRDSTKRNIKKAIKEGVKVKIDNSVERVKEFYRLNCMTRREHGLPPQPPSFFKKIYDHVISKNLGMVVLASFCRENIAGAIYFHFGRKAVYKYGASDKKFQHLRPNNLVMWEAIRWYCRGDYKSLCFGRTEPENQGLIQFKSGWGTTEQPIHYYRYDFTKKSFVQASSEVKGFHNKIFEKLPIPILNQIGSLLYKHIG